MDENGHNPTVYLDRAEMKAAESGIPFDEKPDDGCWNCACRCDCRYGMKPDELCEGWEKDSGAKLRDFYRGNEP